MLFCITFLLVVFGLESSKTQGKNQTITTNIIYYDQVYRRNRLHRWLFFLYHKSGYEITQHIKWAFKKGCDDPIEIGDIYSGVGTENKEDDFLTKDITSVFEMNYNSPMWNTSADTKNKFQLKKKRESKIQSAHPLTCM